MRYIFRGGIEMSKTAKILLILELLLALVFILLIVAVTLKYLSFNQVRYLIYSVLIINPVLAIAFICLHDGKQILDKSQKVIVTFSILIGMILTVWVFLEFI